MPAGAASCASRHRAADTSFLLRIPALLEFLHTLLQQAVVFIALLKLSAFLTQSSQRFSQRFRIDLFESRHSQKPVNLTQFPLDTLFLALEALRRLMEILRFFLQVKAFRFQGLILR